MDDLSAAAQPETEPQASEQITLKPKERRETVLSVIAQAKRHLRISLFRCDDFKVIDELANACRRGVRVQVLLTPRAKGWKKKLKDLENFLLSLGAEVRRYPTLGVKYHAKYIVADDDTALVASLNFTRKCFVKTCDFLVVTRDPAVVSGLQRLFEADSAAAHAGLPEGLSDRLIVGPDRSRSRMTELLSLARRTIRIIDHRVVDPAMVALLKSKQDEGVSVEILGRGQVKGLSSHGKMVLVDEETAVIGSIALSTPSLDFRREVAIVVRDPECVSRLSQFFQSAAAREAREAASAHPGDSVPVPAS